MSQNSLSDWFGPGSNLQKRYVRDADELVRRVSALRELGMTIVLTSGTFDMFHEGHARYLEQAKQRGDILIVGVDSDARVRCRKGPKRPIVTEAERIEILCHLRHVDLVVVKNADDPQRHLIKTIHPDVLITTEGEHGAEAIEALSALCGRVEILPPQSATSTTARLRLFIMETAQEVRGRLRVAFDEVDLFLDSLGGKEGRKEGDAHPERVEAANHETNEGGSS